MTEPKAEWQLVPREPTLDMLKAGYDALKLFTDGETNIGQFRIYEIMLAAAPSPPPSAAVTEGMVEAQERERITKLITMDLLNAIETIHGAVGLDQIVAHAKRANRSRETNTEIDALRATLAVAPQGHGGELQTRPVAFRVKIENNPERWALYQNEEIAQKTADIRRTDYEGLYSRRAEPAPDAGREGK